MSNKDKPLPLRVLPFKQGENINCLIVCDGELNKRLLEKFSSLNKPRKQVKIISCDGASDFLYKCKITPDYIIGDLDSITPKILAYYTRKKVIIKKKTDQYHADLEKALKFALSKKFKNIFITGFSGKRFDHSVSNLSILKRYFKKANVRVFDDKFEMIYTSKTAEFEYKKGAVVSILAMPKAGGITTTGLLYPLKNESLEFGKREGISNRSIGNYVKIEIKKGEALVFRRHFGKIVL